MHICLTNFMGQRILLHIAGGGADAAAVMRRRGGLTDGYKKRSPRRFLRGDRGGRRPTLPLSQYHRRGEA